MASRRPIIAISPKESELGKLLSLEVIQIDYDNALDFANDILSLINNKQMTIQKGRNDWKLVEEVYEKSNIQF